MNAPLKRIMQKTAKVISFTIIVWISGFLFINSYAIKELASFGLAYWNYSYRAEDSIPVKSEYGMIYPFSDLLNDPTPLPVQYINKQSYDYNGLEAESKVNFRRMMFILNFLKSNGIGYTLQLVPVELAKFQVYTCNIFINPSGSNDFRLISAHYDVLSRPDYQGAMDNSASVIVLLNLIKKHHKAMSDNKVAILFTTLEEEGLLGAEAFMYQQTFNITKAICLDGVGRGSLAAMNNSRGSFGFKFKNWLFQDKIFTGTTFRDCPEYERIDRSVIDLDKYGIEPLNAYLSSTDARIFSANGIPTVNLVSSDIVHFVKVLHTEKDKVQGLSYASLIQCERILTIWIQENAVKF